MTFTFLLCLVKAPGQL